MLDPRIAELHRALRYSEDRRHIALASGQHHLVIRFEQLIITYEVMLALREAAVDDARRQTAWTPLTMSGPTGDPVA